MTTYEKIQALCRKNGFEISYISNHVPDLSLTRASLTGWKKGAVPRASTLKKIADFFGVSVEYLMNDSEERAQPKSIFASNIFPATHERYPIVGEIVCGTPTFASQENGEYVESLAHIDADFCLKAKGESMIGAGIKDGDIVFIKQQSAVDNGDIAAVIIEDEATLKRVYYYPEKEKIILTPENPAYEPLVYLGEELEKVNILGRAVAVTSFLRRK